MVWAGGPGGDLLSRGLGRSTMGAGDFHGRVRDGIGCSLPAMATRSSSPYRHCMFGAGAVGILRSPRGLAGSGCFVRTSGSTEARFGDDPGMISVHGVFGRVLPPGMYGYRADRAIRTGQLRALPRFHIQPIDVMVYHGPRGDLV